MFDVVQFRIKLLLCEIDVFCHIAKLLFHIIVLFCHQGIVLCIQLILFPIQPPITDPKDPFDIILFIPHPIVALFVFHIIVFILPNCTDQFVYNNHICWLFTLNSKFVLSVVHKKSIPGDIPALPVKFHPLFDGHVAGSVIVFPLDIDKSFHINDNVCGGVVTVIVSACCDICVSHHHNMLLNLKSTQTLLLNICDHHQRFDAVFASPALHQAAFIVISSLVDDRVMLDHAIRDLNSKFTQFF